MQGFFSGKRRAAGGARRRCSRPRGRRRAPEASRPEARALKALNDRLEAQKSEAEQQAKAEARLLGLSSRRWPVLLAVASAVLLAFLLGLYVGWRQPLG